MSTKEVNPAHLIFGDSIAKFHQASMMEQRESFQWIKLLKKYLRLDIAITSSG